jgi:hypothetical protein
MAATTQVQNLTGMIGAQQEWGNGTTMLVSSIAGGAVAGMLNPASTLGLGTPAVEKNLMFNAAHFGLENCAKGALVGAAKGAAEGAVYAAFMGDDGEYEPWMGFVGGLAGSLAGGVLAAGVSQPIGVNRTTGIGRSATGMGEALNYGMQRMIYSIPSRAVSTGIGYITQGMDRQDSFMVREAARGIYPIVDTIIFSKKTGSHEGIVAPGGVGHITDPANYIIGGGGDPNVNIPLPADVQTGDPVIPNNNN